ncbi:MAG: hypothetical protein ACLTXL_09235 [Clostridia bacterium]
MTDSKPWHLSFTAKTGQIAESQGLQGQSVASLTQENKKDIYFALSEVLPKEETLHMAVVSKVMNDAGHSKEQYGFYKMKLLLQELGEFRHWRKPLWGRTPDASHFACGSGLGSGGRKDGRTRRGISAVEWGALAPT